MKSVFLFLVGISSSLFASEDLLMKFSEDKWKFESKYETEQFETYLYTIEGESINNWTEILTTTRMPRINITLQSYCANVLSSIQSDYPNVSIDYQIIDKGRTSFFFEWWIENQSENPQHNWIRVVNGENNTFVICYSSKKADAIDFELKESIVNAKILDLCRLNVKNECALYTSYSNQMFSFKIPQIWTYMDSFQESLEAGTVFTHVFLLPEENGVIVIEDFPNSQNSSTYEFLKMELETVRKNSTNSIHVVKMKKEDGSQSVGVVFDPQKVSDVNNIKKFSAYYNYANRAIKFTASASSSMFEAYLPLFKTAFLSLKSKPSELK